MKDHETSSWDNATWSGHRRAQIRAALKLSYQERFRALEDFSTTSQWLANAKDDRLPPSRK